MKRLGTFLGLTLIAVGAVGAARAAYDPLKAQLGQWLLDRARADTQSGNPTRPWDWADITPVARISVPRLGVSAVVLGSASGEAMAWGPGHVSGTASPGTPGLSAIAGHRDTHLAFLAETKPGDEVFVETANGLPHRYVVREGLVVDSRHWTLPTRTDGPEKLVLVTCWPFDANFQGPLRFVLYAEPA
ncbi:MAG: class GN sortase [Pseudomonadota bacterium]